MTDCDHPTWYPVSWNRVPLCTECGEPLDNPDPEKRYQRMPTLTLYLHPRQAEALRALARITRRPQAVFVREAIDLVLAKHEASQ